MNRMRSTAVQAFTFALGCAIGSFASAATPDPIPDTGSGPGAGFYDPAGIPDRPVTREADPVYRGPVMDTLATIRERGVLRVGVASDPPMVMHDAKGDLVGFSIDLSRKLAEDMGVTVEFIPTSWLQIIPDLLNGNSDIIITGLWATPARALVLNFSDATSTEGIYLIAGNPLANSRTTLEDFNQSDIRIAVVPGTVQERIAHDMFPKAELVNVEDDLSQLAPVLEGKAHAVLLPTFAPKIIVQATGGKLTLPFEQPLQTTRTAMAVRKGDPDFLNFLNTWIAFQQDDGWLKKQARYWAESPEWRDK